MIWWAMMSRRKGVEGLFDGRHFDREIIVLCVRWYLRYKVSLRDLVEMMAERSLSLAHTTIMRWVKRLVVMQIARAYQKAAFPGGINEPKACPRI
ncbi:transposase (fragment) [Paraburkholderia ribeironis]|uniref:Transposase n=1 Tax=Paraburkholderia ribeironis TaxID=1247936 RepID=A0A1N7RSX1_9BURK